MLANEPQPRRPAIDALTSVRFFFAAMVVVGHFIGHFYPSSFSNWPGFVFSMAPIAVSWFFVLSGFIIAYNYPTLSDGYERKSFMISRFARLWPVHIITMIAMVLLQGGGKYYPFFLTMTHTWTASANMSSAYNGPSWSISDEMFFYLVYVGLVAPARWLRWLIVAAPIALSAGLISKYGCLLPDAIATPKCSTLVWMFPPSRLIEFLTGVAVFHLRPRIPQIIGLAASICVLGGFVPSVPGLGGDPILAHFVGQLEVAIGGAALIASLAHDGWLSRLLSVHFLVIGGEISYAMYMTHQVVNFTVLPYVETLNLFATAVLVTSITLAVSTGLFYFVEAPVRDAVKGWLRHRRPKAAFRSVAEGNAERLA